MHVKPTILAVLISMVCISIPAHAEEGENSANPEAPESRIGLGVSLVHTVINNDQNEYIFSPLGIHGISQIYLSLDAGPLRLEPDFAFLRSAAEDGAIESSISIMRFGIGLFTMSRLGVSARSYIGVRAAVVRTATFSNYNSLEKDRSKIDIYVGPSIGAEYLLGEYFTLGAEVGFDYGRIGNFNKDSDRKSSLMSTRTQIIVRFYP
jgi:hypothetical protein